MVAHYYHKFKNIEFIRFCIVGLFNTCVNYGVYLVSMLALKTHYLIAGAIGFLSGAFVGFFLNRKWTFQAESTPTRLIILYLLVNLASLGINTLVQYCVVHLLSVPELYSQIFGIMITTITNFIGVKFFVFRKASL